MEPDGFLRGLGLGILGELGHMSFYLVLILAAWCPLEGLRCRGWDRYLVVIGTACALSLLFMFGELGTTGLLGSGHSQLVAAATLGCLAASAALQYRGTVSSEGRSSSAQSAAGEEPATQPTWREEGLIAEPLSGSFLGNFKAYNPAEYHPVPTSSHDHTAILTGSTSGVPLYGGTSPTKQGDPEESGGVVLKVVEVLQPLTTASRLLSLFLPVAVILLAQLGSQALEPRPVRAEGGGFLAALGAGVGCMLCLVVAAELGALLARLVPPRSLLVGVSCGLAVLLLLSLRNAAMCFLASKPVASEAAAQTNRVLLQSHRLLGTFAA